MGYQAGRRTVENISTNRKVEITVVVLLTMAMVVFIAIVLQIFAFQTINCAVCQTPLCKETATRVLESLDTTVNPCDDFYEFACRGWIQKNPIQNGFSWDPIWVIRKDVQLKLYRILTEPDKKEDGRPIKLARAMYKTCMDWKALENLGLGPVYDAFTKLGLPHKPPTDREAEGINIPRTVGYAKRFYGKDIFLDMKIAQDWRNGTKNRLMITQPKMVIRNLVRNLLDPESNKVELDLKRGYIKNMWALAGAEKKSDAYTTELMDFMTELAKIMVKPKSRILANDAIKDCTIDDLQRKTDRSANKWNWMAYLNGIFVNTDVIVSKDDIAGVTDMSYMRAFPSLMAKTSLGTIVRYIWWEIWSSLTPQTTEHFRILGHRFLAEMQGPTTRKVRWKACTEFVNKYFDLAITAAYVKKHFNVNETKKAMEMWNDVSSAFNDMLTENSWLEDGTKAQARRKLHSMKPFVGFPEWISDPKKLDKYYKGFEVFDGRLFDTYINLDSVARRAELNGWRQAPDKNKWKTSGTTVNAIYNRIVNSATFPAGYLHIPFYGNGVEAINYGAVGTTMGHELTHGFDSKGYRFDQNGNVRNWWSRIDLKRFWEKATCVLKQYSSYVVAQLGGNINVNGHLTLGENIADNGGLKESFRAYQKLKARTGPQPALPGLDQYTDEQLFFLGFAQMYCGSYTNAELEELIKRDPHAPNRYRVIGTLQNNKAFAKAWNCPDGSPMTDKQRCTVW